MALNDHAIVPGKNINKTILSSLLRALPSALVMNKALQVREFRPHKMVRSRTGINQPPRLFKIGEDDINRMPDDETRAWREWKSLFNIDRIGLIPKKKRRNPLDKRPQLRGIVLKTLIKKPKKPNSANRKCVLVRLTNGREAIAFVPGIGHNLQEHSNVLVKLHRTPDVPGLRLRVIRGVYDCSPIIKRTQQPPSS